MPSRLGARAPGATADKRERLRALISAYCMALAGDGGMADLDIAAIQTKFAVDPKALVGNHDGCFDLATKMAQDAFVLQGRTYYFANDTDVATHCLHLDVLEMPPLVQMTTEDNVTKLNEYLQRCLASPEALVFALTSRFPVDFDVLVDIESMAEVFKKVGRMNGCRFGEILSTVLNARASGIPLRVPTFGDTVVLAPTLLGRSAAFLIVAALGVEFAKMLPLVRHLSNAILVNRGIIVRMLRQCSAPLLQSLVTHFQEVLSLQLLGGSSEAENAMLTGTADVLAVLNAVNYDAAHPRGLLPYNAFYNPTAIDFTIDDMRIDFKRKLENAAAVAQGAPPGHQLFCFSSYPFLIDANFKSVLMQIESSVEQQGAMRNALVGMLFSGPRSGADQFFLFLSIQRSALIDSTLRELRRYRDSLRKPLRITFVGEEGVDEGGLRKEFFQLLTKALLDPAYGMFYEIEETRSLWIQPEVRCSQNRMEFFLIGQILGLAVYNNIILDVAFPRVLFRKLLGAPIGIADLAEIDPGLLAGFELLLDFQETEGETVEDTFCRPFVFEHDVFGTKVDIELVPNGSQIMLNASNRQQFVDAVVNYVLTESIQKNFDEFRNGFMSVCDRGFISTMQPEELELLVCGNPQLNFEDLEKTTRYDGFTKADPTIVFFWEVVHEMSPEEQRKFLKFTTGSDRVPIRGLGDLGFAIGKNGDDSDMLPTSHTCFNHLLLPMYKTKEKLREKLLLAITNCTGFGLK